MPFTPSHVAAVVPLIASRRLLRFVDPWALALGAMIPDVPLFLFFLDYRDWHSPSGVLRYDLPATLAAVLLFQALLRAPITVLFPPALAGRVADLPDDFESTVARVRWKGFGRLGHADDDGDHLGTCSWPNRSWRTPTMRNRGEREEPHCPGCARLRSERQRVPGGRLTRWHVKTRVESARL